MLSERVQNEQVTYDSVHVESTRLQRRFFHVNECPNNKAAEAYMVAVAANAIAGGVVLDLGCYDGKDTAAYAALKPKRLVGIDVSHTGIAEAKRKFSDVGEFFVMDAHRMDFPDNTFDIVIGRSILHHLEYDVAIKEIARVVKPGGIAVFDEPLRDNPAAKLLRAITPKARTKDELPLSRKQIQWTDRLFGGERHRFSGLFSTGIGLFTSLLPIAPDNALLRMVDRIDCLMARSPVRYWMRRAVLVWEKRDQFRNSTNNPS
jgi:ubiquinone/menaquinone biosynthesis C-methylase UbiE